MIDKNDSKYGVIHGGQTGRGENVEKLPAKRFCVGLRLTISEITFPNSMLCVKERLV